MTTHERENFSGRMDRIQVEQLARKAGLPQLLAARVAETVTAAGLADDRREEVFRELVAHFEDGLASGGTPEQLLEAFGDGKRTAAMIREAKRVVTPESLGGTGERDSRLSRIGRDARYAVRRLMARPAFTGIAVLSLALGIGANSAMFTLINDVILRKPPISHPEQLVEIYRSDPNFRWNVFSEPDVADLRRGATALDGIASSKMSFAPYEAGGRTLKLTTELVSAEYFQVLGLRPAHGRLIEPADAPAPGLGAVVVLSDRFWRKAFGGDPSIVGRPIRLNGASYDVLGILPPEYTGRFRAIRTDIYLPVMMVDRFEHSMTSQLVDRDNSGTFVVARLKQGVSLRQAQVEIDRVAGDLKAQHLNGWQSDVKVVVLPKADVIISPPVDEVLVPVAGMLMLVVGLVLVIACANLAGFLLARAVDRRKEIAVRLALGATRAQLITQLLVETVLLALGGGLLGVVLGRLALRAVLSSNFPLPVTIDLALTLDWRVLGFSVAISVAAGLVFGLMPALQSTRMELASVIRDETTGGGRQRWALRHLLVGGQVAVSMVLLVIAGLFIRSLGAARNVDPGFGARPAGIIWLAAGGDQSRSEAAQIAGRLVRRFAEIPGVDAVGMASNLHLNALSTQGRDINVEGIEPPPGRTSHNVDAAAIDTGFIAAAGLTLVAGRNLTMQDADSVIRAALVNEAFAARFFPGRSALGQRFRNGERQVEIAGIVKDAKIRSLSEAPRPFIYTPMTETWGDPIWYVARTTGSAEQAVAAMRRAATEVDSRIFAMQSGTLQGFISTQAYPLKMGATALMAFAVLAMVMACIGLYGAVSYAVAQRSREVGIRLSLGAGPASVVRLLLWGGLRLVLSGAGVGIVLALVVGKLLEGLLFGVKAFDPVTFVLVPLLLIGVAAVAAWVPARRAGLVSPVTALKSE